MHLPSHWSSAADREAARRGAAGGGRSGVSSALPILPGATTISRDVSNIVSFPNGRRGVTYRQLLEAFIERAIGLLDALDADPDLEDEPIEPSGEEDSAYPPFEGTP